VQFQPEKDGLASYERQGPERDQIVKWGLFYEEIECTERKEEEMRALPVDGRGGVFHRMAQLSSGPSDALV